jgi:hypothetical protein
MRVYSMCAVLRLCLAPIAVTLVACAAPGPDAPSGEQAISQARNQLTADVRECSATHGFDPETVSALGERQLAPQELAWRQCAYDAARRYIDRNPAIRGLMEQLIAEDIQMTSAIQQGTLTRTERRARVQTLLGQIRDAEQKQMQAASAQRERQAEEMGTVVEGIRGFAY